MKFSHVIIEKLLLAALFASFLFMPDALAWSAGAEDAQSDSFSRCWDHPVSPDLSVAVESDGDVVYFVDSDRKLSAVDLVSGTRLWTSEIAGDPISNVLAANALVIVASQASPDKAVLRAVSKTTGITQWSSDLPLASTVALGALNGTVVAVSSKGLATAFHTDRGTPSWTKEIGAAVTTTPFFYGKTLIVGTARREVVGISMPDGVASAVTKLDGVPTALFSIEDGNVLIGDDRGNLVLTSIRGKRGWRFRNGARISAIAGYDSEYLATSHDNFLYKITRGGNVEWKRRLSARIDRRPILLDRSVIVSTVGDGNVYVIDAANGKIVNRIETGEEASVQIAGGTKGFAIVSTKGLTFYSSEVCAVSNKKTVPDPAPSREKS